MRRLALAAVLLVALGAPVQGQTPEGAEPDKRLGDVGTPAPPRYVVQNIQTYLHALGYAVGPADGVLAPRTVAAIRAFQTKEGLPHEALEAEALSTVWLYLVAAVPGVDKGLVAYNRGDYATALRVWKANAVLGIAEAQYSLGVMYYHGEGALEDYAEAVKWFRSAAKRGHASAQYNLGIMYQEGKGVAQDYVEAKKWYRKAAKLGDADAQFNLGVMYGKGIGMPQDYVCAHMWFNLSAARGNETARKTRDLVAKKMTPADVSKAQKLAREWMERSCE